jgi:hypothetical protein
VAGCRSPPFEIQKDTRNHDFQNTQTGRDGKGKCNAALHAKLVFQINFENSWKNTNVNELKRDTEV